MSSSAFAAPASGAKAQNAPAGPVAVRITVSDPAWCDRLRDYFLGLGADAEVDGDSAVVVRSRPGVWDADENVPVFLAAWASANSVALEISESTDGTASPCGVPG